MKYFIGTFLMVWLVAECTNVVYATNYSKPNANAHAKAKAVASAKAGAKAVNKTSTKVKQQQKQELTSTVEANDYSNQRYNEAAQSAIATAMTECHGAAGVQGRSFGVSVATRAEFCDHVTLANIKLGLANGLECRSFTKGGGTEDVACYRQRSVYTQEALTHLSNAEDVTKPGFVKKLWSKVW